MKRMKKLINPFIRISLLVILLICGPILSSKIHNSYLFNYKGSSVLKVYSNRGTATAFQIKAKSGSSFIITNRHVCLGVGNNNKIQYATQNGTIGEASILEVLETADLCILTGDPSLRSLKLASNIDPREETYLIGHPGGRSLTMSQGFFINSELLPFCIDNPKQLCEFVYEAYHISNIAYPGNSGSPVLNIYGNVVGVLFAGNRSGVTINFMVSYYDLAKLLSRY